jgi:hypothetical protein
LPLASLEGGTIGPTIYLMITAWEATMPCPRDFTAPLWLVLAGNLLLLACSLFYLAWWGVSFRPGSPGGRAGAILITAAFITGLAAIALMCAGINALSRESRGVPVMYIMAGGAILFLVLLGVTATVFHRAVTSELMIMLIWAALESSAIAVLHGTGRIGAGRAVALAVLVGIATLVGVICYVLYYRLGAEAAYRDGMIPLATDAVVMAVFVGVLAFS